MKQSFSKSERLKHRKQIDDLFKSGHSFSVYPLRIFWKQQQASLLMPATPIPAKLSAGVGVSKRNFNKSVDRNRIKRLLRESWRKQKKVLIDQVAAQNLQVNLFLVYTGKEIPSLDNIEKATVQSIHRLQRLLSEKEVNPKKGNEEN